ncbi:glycosyltransferase [Hansschlegelia quercus]|nr:glycosyltransferase [Hansschlegelia quercus]
MAAIDAVLNGEAGIAPARSAFYDRRSIAPSPATPWLPFDLALLAQNGVPPGPLLAAMRRAELTGCEPLDALIASGAIAEDSIIEALAHGLGARVADGSDHDGPPIDAEMCGQALRSGHVLLFDTAGRLTLHVAARGRHMAQLALDARGRRMTIAVSSPRAFADLVIARAGHALAAHASEGPSLVDPSLSVRDGLPAVDARLRFVVAGLTFAAFAATFALDIAGGMVLGMTSLLFATLNLFRLYVACTPPSPERPMRRDDDRTLPVYTVLVPLAREAAVVPGLMAALERLDYPPEKLDIKILVEAGDAETLFALERRPPRAGVEVLMLPPGGPRTKPRALNAGLIAARGRYLAVFDAEDQPEPGQLREAIQAFATGPTDLACVQARLAIDNIGDGWLARQFAIEYAALFDVVVPALARLGLPIALGGTSNHFDVKVLRKVGGWDAGNVTEDADLGLRLARFGYRTGAIASTTFEESTTRLKPWIRQRTRWMKGFMVTTLVHALNPRGLGRLGALNLAAAGALVGGVALTALAYPAVLALFVWRAIDGSLLAPAESLAGMTFAGLCGASLVIGYSTALACAWMGLERRGLGRLTGDLALMPAYWLLVGIAAWRALWQIAKGETSQWEKTAHGVSRRRTPHP